MGDHDGPDILVVCTGNIARSPMAEALLRNALHARLTPGTVSSAGFATQDRPADPDAQRLLAKRHIDLRGHRSRIITPEIALAADLIICMEREHVRKLTLLDRSLLDRTFTLPELARLARTHRRRRPDEPLADWLASVASGRSPSDVVSVSTVDDVPDPHRRGRRAYRAALEQIEADLETVVDRVF